MFLKKMSCNVCIENFNKKLHSKIECNFCNYAACRKCHESYILSQSQNAHCMNCKREWNRQILSEYFTSTFLNKTYKNHRQKILFEKETALLPATQSAVEEYKTKKILKNEITNIRKEIRNLYNILYQKEDQMSRTNVSGASSSSSFIRKCPNQNCRGFLNTKWTCTLCEMSTCSKCLEVKTESHVCKEEDIQTASLLSKDSKPCPKCGVLICKIDGCSQMWCTQCHTAFDWISGRIEVEIHNPHYYEWLRRTGNIERNPADIQCGREINTVFMFQIVRAGAIKPIIEICRNVIEMRQYIIPRFTVNRLRNNEDIRIKFLLNELTEEKFKKLLQKRDNETVKKHELLNITNMYINCVTDIVFRYFSQLRNEKDLDNRVVELDNSTKNEIENLRIYTNECFDAFSSIYKCKKYYINEIYKFI